MVFALYACSVVVLAVALLRWRREPVQLESSRERFVPALRAGSRYVWHEPVVRRIMLRLVLFVLPAVALWALLPVIASQRLGLSADGFGALFAALGTGAIVGALVLGRVKGRLSVNAMLAVGGLLYAAALAGLVTVASFPAALVILVVSGLAWMIMTSTLQAEMQLILPTWVRARGLALYTVVFMGCQTVGSLLWGLVANQAGLRPGSLVAAGGVLLGALVGLALRVPDTGDLDPQAVVVLARRRGRRRTIRRRRARPGHRTVHRHPGSRTRVPGGHGPASPVPAPDRRDAVGAVPRRRTPLRVRRDLPGSLVGGAPTPARRPADRQPTRSSRNAPSASPTHPPRPSTSCPRNRGAAPVGGSARSHLGQHRTGSRATHRWPVSRS